ncbi:MAG: hypothetical protein RIG84_18620 [Roseovarius sp.]
MRVVRLCLVLLLCLPGLSAWAQNASSDVFVSVHVNNIPKLDTTTNSFALDAYFRFTWSDPAIDPIKGFDVVNPYNGWRSRRTLLYEQPHRLEDGRFFNAIRYEGMFAAPLLLTDYPFERHSLRVLFEDMPHEGAQVRYLPDVTPVTLGENITIRAYQLGAPVLEIVQARALGQAMGAPAPAASRAVLTIPLSRNGAVFGVKVIMPIVVVVITGLLALLLDRELASAQVALLATTLLSLIVLQLSTAPKANYLTMLDSVFVLGRLLLACGLLRVVYAHYRERKGLGPPSPQTDMRLALALMGALVLGVPAIIAGHLAL